MTKLTAPAVSIATLLLCGLASRANAADDIPTAEQLQQLAAEKKWPEVLTGTSRVLALRGEKAAGYDRVAMWSLKAEAQIQSSQFVPAAESFEKASEEPNAKPDEVDWCYSMSALMRKSDRRGYKPETSRDNPNPPAFDILKESERKSAIASLFDSEMGALDKRFVKIRPVLGAKPTVDLLKDAAKLQRMERAGTGKAGRTEKLAADVAAAFVENSAKWSEPVLQRIAAISKAANELVRVREPDDKRSTGRDRDKDGIVDRRVRYRKKGLTSADSKELRDFKTAAVTLAENYKEIEQALPEPDRAAMAPAKPVVQKVYDEADAVLKGDYVTETVKRE